MKKYFCLAIMSACAIAARGQYQVFNTKITCATNKKEIVVKGDAMIHENLQRLVKEGKLFSFTDELKLGSDNLQVNLSFAAGNENEFRTINAEWKKRLESSAPEVSRAFWEACPIRKDTLSNSNKVIFPVVRHLWASVVVVTGVDEKPDPTAEYKIIFDFTAFPQVEGKDAKFDSAALSWGVAEIGRIYNLHVAAGIPKERIHLAAAVHAFAAPTFFSNEAYHKKYKTTILILSISWSLIDWV